MAAQHALERHVALVGFMGSGKWTLDPLRAERLGRPFVSVDAVVEERTGSSVAEIFESRGDYVQVYHPGTRPKDVEALEDFTAQHGAEFDPRSFLDQVDEG